MTLVLDIEGKAIVKLTRKDGSFQTIVIKQITGKEPCNLWEEHVPAFRSAGIWCYCHRCTTCEYCHSIGKSDVQIQPFIWEKSAEVPKGCQAILVPEPMTKTYCHYLPVITSTGIHTGIALAVGWHFGNEIYRCGKSTTWFANVPAKDEDFEHYNVFFVHV